jgi:membrane protease YdiL (CAAX protease family)
MIGILMQLLISYVILYFVDDRRLEALGVLPNKKRLIDFSILFSASVVACSSGFILRMLLAKENWGLNPLFNLKLLADGIWWNIKSVMFEELIFRAALLFLLIKWFGKTIALLVSAISFGIYHWFSLEVFGNPWMMLQIFLSSALVGIVWAWAFVKSQSIYSAIAMHLGWNFTQNFIFSNGPIGKGIWMLLEPSPQITVGYFTYFLVFYFPMILFIGLSIFLLMIRNKKGSAISQ